MNVLPVASAIAENLVPPKPSPGCGPFEQVAIMAVPEAAVYLDDGMVAWEQEIRFARKIRIVESIPEPAPVQATSYE